MSMHSFRGITMVASCAAAALGCYLVSLRVASERAALENVETEIVMTQRDIRTLQTEIGTRGRLAQLERWNVKVLALSAPSADQILGGSFALAKLVAPPPRDAIAAPVVLASAPANGPRPQVEGADEAAYGEGIPTSALLHQTSLTRVMPEAPERATMAPMTAPPVKAPPVKAASVAKLKAEPKAAVKAANKTVAKAPAVAATKPAAKPRTATADPLGPLGGVPKKPTSVASATPLKSSAREPAGRP
jgi:hypothetical protein